MPSLRTFSFAMALAGVLTAQAASARPTLVQSRPEQGAVVSRPLTMDLTFSTSVPAKDLAITLTMTAMPGMATHKPMAIKGFEVVPAGAKVGLRFPRPLPTGTYQLAWTIAGEADSGASGSFMFKVS